MSFYSAQDSMKGVEGSPSRDRFKKIHRDHPDAPRGYYGCDLDFSFAVKKPERGVAAFIDYKEPGDSVSFTEVIVYNALLDADFWVFIVSGVVEIASTDPDEHRFNIDRYKQSNPIPDPPDVNTTRLQTELNWNEFFEWEGRVRQAWAQWEVTDD